MDDSIPTIDFIIGKFLVGSILYLQEDCVTQWQSVRFQISKPRVQLPSRSGFFYVNI